MRGSGGLGVLAPQAYQGPGEMSLFGLALRLLWPFLLDSLPWMNLVSGRKTLL